MIKMEIKNRILKNGQPLSPQLYTWDAKTRTFSSKEADLVIDFGGIEFCTVVAGSGCDVTTDSRCTVRTGRYCTVTTDSYCTVTTGENCTVTTDYSCTVVATGYACTVTTGNNCTVTADSSCTVKTGERCVIVRRDVYEVIEPKEGDCIKFFPYNQKGHLVNGMYNGKPHIIADGIVSEIINKKGSVYKVKKLGGELGGDKVTFLIEQDGIYSHGDTLKEARESLIYKMEDRDASAYEGMTLETTLSEAEWIKAYRTITGACEKGVRDFVESFPERKATYSCAEILKNTDGEYGHEDLLDFINGEAE